MSQPLGPNRQAAVDERRSEAHCCVCDRLILGNGPGKRAGTYTCGRKDCRREWTRLCVADLRAALKAAHEDFDKAGMA